MNYYRHMKRDGSSHMEEVGGTQRVPITLLGCLIAAGMIGCCLVLVLQKNTFIAKRKAFQYMVLSSIGLLFYIKDTVHIAWTYPTYINDVGATYAYYLGAVPVHFIPVMVRSWRIYCVYKATPTWRFTMEPITSKRRRGHQWMITRIVVLFIPWILTAIGLVFDPDIPYYIFIGWHGVYAIANFVLTCLLYKMKNELRQKYLDETLSLLAFSILSLIEWAWANCIYILAILVEIKDIIVYYMYVDLVLVALMFFASTGKTMYRVWLRRGLEGDKKPELAQSEIKRAKQLIDSKVSSSSLDFSYSGTEIESGVQKA